MEQERLRSKLAIHQNGVEFCQQFNGASIISLIASYNDILCDVAEKFITKFITHTETRTHEHTGSGQYDLYSEVALTKKNKHGLKML